MSLQPREAASVISLIVFATPAGRSNQAGSWLVTATLMVGEGRELIVKQKAVDFFFWSSETEKFLGLSVSSI